MADYKGYVQLMRQCGARDVDAQVVREGDVFQYQLGSHAELRHVPGHTRGKITHAYALVRLAHNVCKFEVMDVAEIDKLRRQYGTPKNKELTETPEWYARKTVLRRVQKYVPQAGDLGLRLQAAMGDEIDDAEITPVDGEVQPISAHLPTSAPVPKLSTGATEELGGEPEGITRVVVTEPLTFEPDTDGAYDPDA